MIAIKPKYSTNSCNYKNYITNTTNVGSNGGPSSMGTFDQSGQLFELIDNDTPSSNTIIRGGYWKNTSSNRLSKNNRYTILSTTTARSIGLRIASKHNIHTYTNYVNIEYINNISDTSGYGSVGYSYLINKYLLTNIEYCNFLNAVAKIDTYNLYIQNMNNNFIGCINRVLTIEGYNYSVKINTENKPINYISWFNAARYCNWLHNNKPVGNQNTSTTEDGAYTLNGAVSGDTIARNEVAKYYIPNENEWYKAAYYNINNGQYNTYATNSNLSPNPIKTSLDLSTSYDGIPYTINIKLKQL